MPCIRFHLPRRRGSVVSSSPHPGPVRRSPLAASLLLACLGGSVLPGPVQAQQSMFGTMAVEQQRFVLVAAPIGSSSRFQLNIYEQVKDRRPCFRVGSGLPAQVEPLLATFDFTGICSRYIDANGYSLRIGGSDLAATYRLLVRSEASGTLLVALPTRDGAGPEMVVARSGGPISGFHLLQPEPGWSLMRRTYAGRRLGHLYIYSDSWPAASLPPAPAVAPQAPRPGWTSTPGRTGPDASPPLRAPLPAPSVASPSPAVPAAPAVEPPGRTALPVAPPPRP